MDISSNVKPRRERGRLGEAGRAKCNTPRLAGLGVANKTCNAQKLASPSFWRTSLRDAV